MGANAAGIVVVETQACDGVRWSLRMRKGGRYEPVVLQYLGTGRLGGRYIDIVKEADGVDMKAVAEPREEQVAPLKMSHPDVDFVADYRGVARPGRHSHRDRHAAPLAPQAGGG